jgi:hypothetical protein
MASKDRDDMPKTLMGKTVEFIVAVLVLGFGLLLVSAGLSVK